MIEEPREPDEPDEPDYAHCTPDCLDACYFAGEHVMGCPHGPDSDIPYDWEPDFNAESDRERHEREYKEKPGESGRVIEVCRRK